MSKKRGCALQFKSHYPILTCFYFLPSPDALTERRLETSHRDAKTRYQSHCDENNKIKRQEREILVCRLYSKKRREIGKGGLARQGFFVKGLKVKVSARVQSQGQNQRQPRSRSLPLFEGQGPRSAPPKKGQASDSKTHIQRKKTLTTQKDGKVGRAMTASGSPPPPKKNPQTPAHTRVLHAPRLHRFARAWLAYTTRRKVSRVRFKL